MDELELLIENSLNLIQAASISNKIVPGGGAIEMQVARQLSNFALQFSGREQLAIKDFADALLELPRNLAMNNGLNSDDAILQLRKLHSDGLSNYGLNADNFCGDACIELLNSKIAVVRRAYEVASLMLRIDEQIISKEIPKFHKQVGLFNNQTIFLERLRVDLPKRICRLIIPPLDRLSKASRSRIL